MIEDFAKLIPETLMVIPGTAFRSGRRSFGAPSDLYILDYHPGGDDPDTIRDHTGRVLENEPDDWASWIDERWEHYPGEHPTQKRMRYLFDRIKINPREVPASTLVFERSSKQLTGREMRKLAEPWWHFHEAVIRTLKIKVVVCLGIGVGEFVSAKLDAEPTGDNFTEKNGRGWTSRTYKSPGGLYVVALPNPKRAADWRKAEEGPIVLVERALEKVR